MAPEVGQIADSKTTEEAAKSRIVSSLFTVIYSYIIIHDFRSHGHDSGFRAAVQAGRTQTVSKLRVLTCCRSQDGASRASSPALDCSISGGRGMHVGAGGQSASEDFGMQRESEWPVEPQFLKASSKANSSLAEFRSAFAFPRLCHPERSRFSGAAKHFRLTCLMRKPNCTTIQSQASCAKTVQDAFFISAPRWMLRKLSMTSSLKGEDHKFRHYREAGSVLLGCCS